MAINGVVPPLNATGLYTVTAPFKLQPGAAYQCIATREFRDLSNNNIPVWERYYSPYGLSKEQYQTDVNNGVVLVTLFSDDYGAVYIPSSFIESYPDLSGVRFRHRIASVSLGAIPDTLPLEDFQKKLSELASDVVGIEPTVIIHSVELSDAVSSDDALRFEQARQARIKDRDTTYAQLTAARKEIDTLRAENALLQEMLDQK
jgi:hypothetical protein